MLLKVLREKKPDYVAVVFDAPGPTFRHEVFGNYKANRPPMPENLRAQVPHIKEVVKALRIPMLEEGGIRSRRPDRGDHEKICPRRVGNHHRFGG